MNSTLPLAPQAEFSIKSQGFPQPIPSVVLDMPFSAACEATLTFFDAGAIDADTAESWITLLEHIKS